MKRCPTCRRDLPYNAFSRQTDKPMGLRAICKQCIAEKRRIIVSLPKNTPPQLTCGLCGKTKAFPKFAIDMGKISGRKSYCLDCQKAKQKERILANPVAINAARTASNRRSWERHPEKRAARIKLGNALRRHEIIKEPCIRCGATKVQAHHEDYGRPLDVVWLCSACHNDYHTGRWPEQMRREREAAAVA